MYTLIGHPQSRSLRVIRTLEELQLPYDLVAARPRSDEALQYNSTGKIPTLVDGGAVITDSVAIVTYLTDKHGQLTHPAGTIARAQQDAITNYIVTEVDAALWLNGKHTFALPEKQRVPEVRETAQAEFIHSMEHLTAVLGNQTYLTGEVLTVPDIILSHCAGWALSLKWALPDGLMGDYLKRLRKTRAMDRTMAVVAAHQ